MHRSRLVAGVAAAVAFVAAGAEPASAASQCDRLLEQLAGRLADASCFESADLTTNNAATTPADNSLAGLPPLAFMPQADRTLIAPPAGIRAPVTRAVPGIQIQARVADDPLGQARVVIRVPSDWNGRLVVAGASGTRSEFNGDFVWSDYVVQRGYAYVSQNKGTYNLKRSDASDPLACRLNPSSNVWVHFYDNDPGQEFSRWGRFMVEAAAIGRSSLEILHGRAPERTYAVGTSNGGYQVRRAVETAPDLFDGGVDWEGTFVDPAPPNLLTALPAAILNYPDYAKSGFDPASAAYRAMREAGYPPDLTVASGGAVKSLWGIHFDQFWEVTQCQWQKRLDPAYDTYGAGTATYRYADRLASSPAGANTAAFATTGLIRRPLVTVAGTLDALLPIDMHARAYARKVEAAQAHDGRETAADYRLYEVQNGNHVDTLVPQFPQLQYLEPHAHKAFDLLVASIEHNSPLPPSQCIPKGSEISAAPAQPGHCADLLVK